MLLHGGQFLQRKAERIDHEDCLGSINVVSVTELKGDDEENE